MKTGSALTKSGEDAGQSKQKAFVIGKPKQLLLQLSYLYNSVELAV